MKAITQQKPFEEIRKSLEREQRVYLVGCGTCATMCQTGGKSEVLEMKDKLEKAGKEITGWMVISTACDSLTREALKEDIEAVQQADAILAMACGFGVQTVAQYVEKLVYPALNTLLLGHEESPGHFSRICIQCGDCLLDYTGGICPLTACTKGLLNGPCGGASKGKCELGPDKDCGWELIYERLKKLNQLERLKKFIEPKDYSKLMPSVKLMSTSR